MKLLKSITSIFKSEEASPGVKPGRNDVCWCGSGKKYKKCHLHHDEEKMSKKWSANCGPT